MRRRVLFLVIALAALGGGLRAQPQDLQPDKPAANPPVPTITFRFDFPGANPSHYVISVESTGRTAYTSTAPDDENSGYATPGRQPAGDPYTARFVISAATAENIFETAKRLDYFNGNFDYTKSRVANTGAKTLIYADPARHFETSYNWSQTADVMDLTRIFQNISSTLEFDRRLQHELHYQKLALDAELKQLEDAAKNNNAAELQVLAPTLQKIVNDPGVLHIARQRAQGLLAATPK